MQVTILEGFILPAIALFLYMSIWAIVAIVKNRADLADVAWGFGFVLVAWISFCSHPFSSLSLLVNLLVTLWALRLGIYIFLKNRHKEEDFRYQDLKNRWGSKIKVRIFFQVFMLQGCILYIISLPILWIHSHPIEISESILWTALPFWVLGFLTETIGDYQLSSFRKNPSNRGKLLMTGFWSYSRHPNYLGEIIQWWAIWMMTFSLPLTWAFVISPLLISFLIIKVSGIPLLEERMKKNPAFENYAKTTAKLVPLPLAIWILYSLGWALIIWFGAKGFVILPLLCWAMCYGFQIHLFAKSDLKSLLICFPLSMYALFLGCIQEILFIHFNILSYPGQEIFPPVWLLSLYTLFALTLNSSLYYLNWNLLLAFVLGGVGGSLSYFSGEKLGGVIVVSNLCYLALFLSWGVYLTLMILLNRKLIGLREKILNSEKIKNMNHIGKGFLLLAIFSEAPGFRHLFHLVQLFRGGEKWK